MVKYRTFEQTAHRRGKKSGDKLRELLCEDTLEVRIMVVKELEKLYEAIAIHFNLCGAEETVEGAIVNLKKEIGLKVFNAVKSEKSRYIRHLIYEPVEEVLTSYYPLVIRHIKLLELYDLGAEVSRQENIQKLRSERMKEYNKTRREAKNGKKR